MYVGGTYCKIPFVDKTPLTHTHTHTHICRIRAIATKSYRDIQSVAKSSKISDGTAVGSFLIFSFNLFIKYGWIYAIFR